MDVHLRALRYFVAVAEQLHFGRAAESLYVSQPALSKQIRSLESQLRVRLFDRDPRTVRLTAAGTALLPVARELLAQWARGEAAVAAAADAAESTLTIGMSTGLGRDLLPAVRARLAEIAPSAGLRLRQVSWKDPVAGIGGETGEDGVDAAFVWLPLRADRFAWIMVATEPRIVLMPRSHPCAGESQIAFDTLLEEPFLALPADAGAARDHWLAVEARGGRAPVIGAEIASTDETREALLAGLGICLVAAGNVPLFRHDDLVAIPVTGVGRRSWCLPGVVGTTDRCWEPSSPRRGRPVAEVTPLCDQTEHRGDQGDAHRDELDHRAARPGEAPGLEVVADVRREDRADEECGRHHDRRDEDPPAAYGEDDQGDHREDDRAGWDGGVLRPSGYLQRDRCGCHEQADDDEVTETHGAESRRPQRLVNPPRGGADVRGSA
ncbi:LysR family transcriptional regulator [Nocardioides turkmenicus]|uniref:LysR family transcriptional regulator n=1 Tax=Nocardioides turkmenicus TaxID=2711220 RepID=UPI0019D29380|nr:LysR family transcriptional regulator [Nocardioides sp. KC13]